MPDRVNIYEVGPRDGLQNESNMIATKDKIALIDQLSVCGFRKIEATSFVNPKWVPQMADAHDVMSGIVRATGIDYAVLTPNLRGLSSAKEAGATEVAIFASASEGFSQKNINCSIEESLQRFAPLMTAAKAAGISVRGYVSCVVECPYDGKTSPSDVIAVTQSLLELGCYEVSLGDTLGRATPDEIDILLSEITSVHAPHKLAGHFHDTNGNALLNIDVALQYGLRTFDASVGGLGGCPYAPGAAGNVATEQVVSHCQSLGIETGIDLSALKSVAIFAKSLRSN